MEEDHIELFTKFAGQRKFTWDELMAEFMARLESCEYETVVDVYNRVAYKLGLHPVESVYDEKREEEVFYEVYQ